MILQRDQGFRFLVNVHRRSDAILSVKRQAGQGRLTDDARLDLDRNESWMYSRTASGRLRLVCSTPTDPNKTRSVSAKVAGDEVSLNARNKGVSEIEILLCRTFPSGEHALLEVLAFAAHNSLPNSMISLC